MNSEEALSLLRDGVSGYFVDDSIEDGINQMREHYFASKSHPEWHQRQQAFRIVLEHCSSSDVDNLVQHGFNRYLPMLEGGAKKFLSHIYESVFET